MFSTKILFFFAIGGGILKDIFVRVIEDIYPLLVTLFASTRRLFRRGVEAKGGGAGSLHFAWKRADWRAK